MLKFFLRKIINKKLFQYFCINLIRKNIIPKKFKNLITLDGFYKIYKSDIEIFNDRFDAVSRDLCIFGIPKKEMIIFKKFLLEIKYADSFLDIGAGVGLYSLFAMKNNPMVHICSVEANPFIYKKLLKNLQNNNNLDVLTLNKAVTNNVGNIEFYIPTGDDFSYATFYKDILNEKNIPFTSVIVPSTDLKEEIKIGFDVIKIDVEGAELEVLEGIEDKLKKCKFLFIEITNKNKNEAFELLKKLSFDVIIDSDEYVGNYVFKNSGAGS